MLDLTHEDKIIQEWLLECPRLREQAEARREDILGRSPSTSLASMVDGNTGISDKTGQTGTDLAEMAQIEQVIKLIEDFEKALPPERRVFLELRREYKYHGGQKGYTSRIQYQFARQMAQRTGHEAYYSFHHRNTFASWWKDMINALAREALRRGIQIKK